MLFRSLRALCSFWNLSVSPADLHSLARSLGADVPFFLCPTHAFASGIGETLEPLPLRIPLHALLVFPGVSVSTAWAYTALGRDERLRDTHPPQYFIDKVRELSTTSARVDMVNHFEEAVFNEFPSVASVATFLRSSLCRASFMSGSGSTLVALFDTRQQALELSASLNHVHSCVCEFVDTIPFEVLQ